MSRRRFTKSERQAAALISDRVDEGLDADHIKPYSSGGETSVENCQLISSRVNRSKGSKFMELREWQQRFVRKWDRRDSNASFLLVAIPGSGKTFASLTVASNWLAAGSDRRVVIVVPTDNLRSQWRDEAAKLGMELQTKEFGTDFKHGFQGCVTTYQSVAHQPMVYRKLCSVSPTLCIFDEMHHCGDDASFGKAVKEAFSLTRDRLLLSGTPWKTDGTPIPFVRYDGNGFPKADFRYDYPEALQHEVVRYLVFDYSGGEIEYEESGRVEEVNESITDDEASKRLTKLLDYEGDFICQQVRLAHRKLRECRRTIPDAAAMAACSDKRHAEQIARVIKKETGCKPSVIVSDSDIANDTVKGFRETDSEWLVAVRQVSEGTDIKRLQVLCYFTNYATEVFFRQIIGRVSRVRGLDDFEGYVYLPADPRLIQFAKNIENAQLHALRDQAAKESREIEQPDRDGIVFEPYTTRKTGVDVVLIANKQYPRQEAALIERAAEAAGVSMEKAATAFDIFRGGSVSEQITPEVAEPLEEKTNRIRAMCSKLAFRLSKLRDVHVSEIHGQFTRQDSMSFDQLKAKEKRLRRWIADESS